MALSLKQVDIVMGQDIYEPHGNQKSKSDNRYTKTRKKQAQHSTKENYQNIKEETKRIKNREELQKQPGDK